MSAIRGAPSPKPERIIMLSYVGGKICTLDLLRVPADLSCMGTPPTAGDTGISNFYGELLVKPIRRLFPSLSESGTQSYSV